MWRYYLFRANGDGTETPIYHSGLPLLDVSVDVELSGPGGIKASLKPEQQGMTAADGSPLFVPWSTVLYAEKDGVIRQGGILTEPTDDGPTLGLDFIGHSGYPNGQPYTGDDQWVQVDPLSLVRHIWWHLQQKKGANLGVVVDETTSPVRVGKAVPEGETAARADGPYILGWWETHDLGKTVDDLATETPFDYLLSHAWDGDTVAHRLQLGYPTIGRRRDDLRFVVGENIFVQPTITYDGEDYADEVLMLGAGEGRKMIRALSPQRPNTGRLRRTAVMEDKTLTSQDAADRAALDELSYRLGSADIQSVTLGPEAPTGYTVGDEILITTKKGWHDGLNLWVRILAVSTDTGTDTHTLTVARSEKGNR